MPDWNDITKEIRETGSVQDSIRRRSMKDYAEQSQRNVIVYYSGWLHKPQHMTGIEFSVTDDDKISFMTSIHGMDRKKGLDLFLHTPGGEMAATESLVDYLLSMFGNNIRMIVPQLALSAGTMIACAGKEIIMGKHSSLGPIDPQIQGLPAHGILEEFDQAIEDCMKDERKIAIWENIIGQYFPTLVGESKKAIAWAEEVVTKWLVNGMLADNPDRDMVVKKIVTELGDHALTKSHSRHLSGTYCKNIGLNIKMIEEDYPDLQDLILTIHHATIHTLTSQRIAKLVENQDGITRVIKMPQSRGSSFPFPFGLFNDSD